MAARTSWAMLFRSDIEPDADTRDADMRPIRIDPKSDLAKRITARHATPETKIA